MFSGRHESEKTNESERLSPPILCKKADKIEKQIAEYLPMKFPPLIQSHCLASFS